MYLNLVISFTLLYSVTLGSACPTIQSPSVQYPLDQTPRPEPQVLAQVITKCVKPNQAALTFDDGPYVYNADLRNILRNAGAKATFFFNGNNWGCIYDPTFAGHVKAAYDAGHQVASHTWAHRDLATLTWDQIHDEMWRVERALQVITGAYPAMMRPPYGSYNDQVRQVSENRGQKIILWDLDSGDSSGLTPAQSKARYDQTIANHPSNILTLNHEVKSSTAYDVLPYAIQKLKAAGYQLVTVAQCTGAPAYQYVTSPSPRDSSWHC